MPGKNIVIFQPVNILVVYGVILENDSICTRRLPIFCLRMSITGWRRALADDDLWTLNEEDRSRELIQEWEKRWTPRVKKYYLKKEARLHSASTKIPSENVKFVPPAKRAAVKLPAQPSILWCLFLSFKHMLIPATILKTAADTIQFANPRLLR